MILCGANAYEQKFYLSPDFEGLPTQIREELQIMCVLYTEEIGGIIIMEFDDNDGTLLLKTTSQENDFMYDHIGGELRIKQLLRDKQDLFRQLETYYQVFVKGDIPAKLLEESEDA